MQTLQEEIQVDETTEEYQNEVATEHNRSAMWEYWDKKILAES